MQTGEKHQTYSNYIVNNMNYSIFCRPGGAGIVRGIQVSEFLGAKLNPTEGFEDDLCIYVKRVPPKNYPKHSYLDVVDAPRAVQWLKTHPNIGVIAISEIAQEYLNKELNRKDVIFIPHHHCNYERWLRPEEKEVKVVGIIGSQNAFQYPIEDLRDALRDRGMELAYKPDFWETYNNFPSENGKNGREKVCNFYKTIDIQVVWRLSAWSKSYEPFRNVLKLENSGSFGIPTISYPEPSYVREWEHNFLEAHNIDELLRYVKTLKEQPAVYHEYAIRGWVKSQEYHVDRIKQRYLNLP